MEGTTSYILDASVIVKLLNQENESHTKEALDIIERAARGIIAVSTSELAVYEVFNALIKGKGLTGRPLQKATEAFYLLPLSFLPTIRTVAVSAAIIAEKQKITF
jgi:predicted nucleic acid-binding protein